MAHLLLWIYALSGAAALLYQVVWQRWLVYTVGLSTVSIGIIVAGFLSGLGLGYLAGGRWADRLQPRQAVLTFAVLETGIAVAALLSGPLLHGWLPTVGGLGPEAPARTYAAVLVLLLPPTFLMGASLPILSRSIQWPTLLDQSGFISRLYFANTLGGAVAAVLTALLLVGTLGYDGSVRVGAALNVLCAAGALLLLHRMGLLSAPAATSASPVAVDRHAHQLVRMALAAPEGATPSRLWWTGWFAHAFAAGLTGIAWELLAFRVVENMVKSRAQTFAVILGVFLAGLAFGGLLGDRLRHRLGAHRRTVFLASQTALYIWIAGCLVALIYALEHWGVARPWLEALAAYDGNGGRGIVLANYLLLPMLVLFVPAVLMGCGFSLSQQLLQTSFAAVGRRLGWVQFVNILGCVAGATLTTMVALPWLGTSGSVQAVAAIGVVYAGVWWAGATTRRWVPGLAAGLLVASVAAVPAQDHLWRVLAGQSGPGRLLYREDASGVSSIRFDSRQSANATVFANGLGQSVLPRHRDSGHVLLGAIPTFVHPRPRHVGIIGLGSGGTLWGASARRDTERIVAWEVMESQGALLAEYAVRTSDQSIDWFLRDPRIAITHADGRHALLANPDRFDVIEADALRPTSSYAGNLYSVEFFQLVRSKLHPGGLSATWVPTPRVLETMRRVFPHVVYLADFVALGSDTPIDVGWPVVRQRLQDPAVQDYFARGRLNIAELMAPVFEKGAAALPPLGVYDPEAVNTDMHPRDELPSPFVLLRGLLAQ